MAEHEVFLSHFQVHVKVIPFVALSQPYTNRLNPRNNTKRPTTVPAVSIGRRDSTSADDRWLFSLLLARLNVHALYLLCKRQVLHWSAAGSFAVFRNP